jgi:hypothetical protein
VSDLCGKWLITEFGYYGLVSLPDRNVVTDPGAYDKAVVMQRESGIQQLYKWAIAVVDRYREEAKKAVDGRERPPKPNEFVKYASKIQKRYHSDVMLSDPGTIEEHKLMHEILGTVEHDSDKMLERALEGEIKDNAENVRQYTNEPLAVKEAELNNKPDNLPGDPKQAQPMSEERKRELARKRNKNKGSQVRPKNKPVADNTMASAPPIDLTDNAIN